MSTINSLKNPLYNKPLYFEGGGFISGRRGRGGGQDGDERVLGGGGGDALHLACTNETST